MANKYGITDSTIQSMIDQTQNKSTSPSAWGNASNEVKTDAINKTIASCEKAGYTQEQTMDILSIMYVESGFSHWVISKDGLGFGFREFYLHGFSYFITIDWKTLTPYLSKDSHSLIYDSRYPYPDKIEDRE